MEMKKEAKNREGGVVCKFLCKNPIIYFVLTAIIGIYIMNSLYSKFSTLYLLRIRDFLLEYKFELIFYFVLALGLIYIGDKCGKVEKDIFNMSQAKQEKVSYVLRIIDKVCTGISVVILGWSTISLIRNGYGFVLSTIIAKGRIFVIFNGIGGIANLYADFICNESQNNRDTDVKLNESEQEEEIQRNESTKSDTTANVEIEQSGREKKNPIKTFIVVVIAIGIVLMATSKFSNKDIVDKEALEYLQNATYNDEPATLKEVLENYWHDGKWYVYKQNDERGIERTVVEYALDEDRLTNIRFRVDVDENSIEPIAYIEDRVARTPFDYQIIQKMYDTYYEEVGVEKKSENSNNTDDVEFEETNDYYEESVTDEGCDSDWGYWNSYEREDGLSFTIYPIDTQTCYLAFGNEDGTIDVRDVEAVKTGDNEAECTAPNGAKLYLEIDWEDGMITILQEGYLDYCEGIDFSGIYQGEDSVY